MVKPIVRTISNKEFKKRTGLKRGGYTVNNTIYRTKDSGEFVVEHEKAHVELGHQPADLNIYQFIKRELKADKMAVERTDEHYRKYYLNNIVNDASERFNRPKSEVRVIVNKEAKKLGLVK